MTAPAYVLDGRRTTSLDAFFAEFGRVVVGREDWGASLDALGDALRGHGPTPAPVRLVWRHAAAARAALGYPEAVRERTRRLRDCAPNVMIKTAWALRAALRGEGPTLFDEVVTHLRAHPNVALILEE